MKLNKIVIYGALGYAAYLLIKGSNKGIFGKYIKSKFMPVYVDGKPNKKLIKASNKRPGVYLIKVNGNLRYIGYSTYNVYKTLTRHFQNWSGYFNEQARVTYPKGDNVTARVIYTNTPGQAIKLESALILKYKPIDNPYKLVTKEPTAETEKQVEAYQEAAEYMEPPF